MFVSTGLYAVSSQTSNQALLLLRHAMVWTKGAKDNEFPTGDIAAQIGRSGLSFMQPSRQQGSWFKVFRHIFHADVVTREQFI